MVMFDGSDFLDCHAAGLILIMSIWEFGIQQAFCMNCAVRLGNSYITEETAIRLANHNLIDILSCCDIPMHVRPVCDIVI